MQRQKDWKFEASLGFICNETLPLKIIKKEKEREYSESWDIHSKEA
jgi:hypothetical protein